MTLRSVPDPFARMGPLRGFVDPKKEDYCQARARGLSSVKASEEAGVSRQTGQTWSEKDEILDRIRELRQSTESYTEVSVGYVLEELKITASEARDAGQFKAAVDALKALYDIVSRDKSGQRAAALGMAAGPRQLSSGAVRNSLTEALSKPELALPIDTTAEDHDDGDPDA